MAGFLVLKVRYQSWRVFGHLVFILFHLFWHVCVLFPRKIVFKNMRFQSFALGYPFIAATAAMKTAHAYKGFTLFSVMLNCQEVSCEKK